MGGGWGCEDQYKFACREGSVRDLHVFSVVVVAVYWRYITYIAIAVIISYCTMQLYYKLASTQQKGGVLSIYMYTTKARKGAKCKDEMSGYIYKAHSIHCDKYFKRHLKLKRIRYSFKLNYALTQLVYI